ncbi:MAG: thioredoxin family protein [Myxococcales bacterium]|nr:thioredoxin family protein [Myxococcales bacterium]
MSPRRDLRPGLWTGVLSALLACTGSQEPVPKASPVPAQPVEAEAPARVATAPSHGFNDAIAWRSFDEGFHEAAREGRPLMLLVHASWCPKCKHLRKNFQDDALVEISDKFVMVNVDQDAEPAVERHGPDGTYIPRVLFFRPDGTLDPDLQNPGRSRFRYFYMPQDDLVGAMRRALDTLSDDDGTRS